MWKNMIQSYKIQQNLQYNKWIYTKILEMKYSRNILLRNIRLYIIMEQIEKYLLNFMYKTQETNKRNDYVRVEQKKREQKNKHKKSWYFYKLVHFLFFLFLIEKFCIWVKTRTNKVQHVLNTEKTNTRPLFFSKQLFSIFKKSLSK